MLLYIFHTGDFLKVLKRLPLRSSITDSVLAPTSIPDRLQETQFLKLQYISMDSGIRFIQKSLPNCLVDNAALSYNDSQ